MDSHRYEYGGRRDLSAGELFFHIVVDTAMAHLGVADTGAMVGVILGQNDVPTRAKFGGAIKGTSTASIVSRRYLNVDLRRRVFPTLVGSRPWELRVRFTRNLGAFVGRSVPVVGWIILATDVTIIMYRSVQTYQSLAHPDDAIF